MDGYFLVLNGGTDFYPFSLSSSHKQGENQELMPHVGGMESFLRKWLSSAAEIGIV